MAFSNDSSVAGNGIYILGSTPGQAIDRVVRYSRGRGAARFGALVPTGVYGQRAAQAMLGSVRGAGGQMVGMETFSRTASAARSAAVSLNARGSMDAVLVADSGTIAAAAAAAIKVGPRLLGTELWSNDRTLGQTPRLRGAFYAAAPDARFAELVSRYRARYGKTPYRIGILYMLRAADGTDRSAIGRGAAVPAAPLSDPGGSRVDGIVRFGRDGVAQRMLEVRQVTATGTIVVSPAANAFPK